jgi:hypothetical protein
MDPFVKKTSKHTTKPFPNDNEILADSNALLNTCGYPEEEINHSTEKREEEKEAIYLPKVQEGRNNAYKRTRRKGRNNLHKRGKRSNKFMEEKEELIKIIKQTIILPF